MRELMEAICRENDVQCQRIEQVFGGDINQAYCLFTNKGRFFIKLNSAALYPGMFLCEAGGLTTLSGKSALKIPAVIQHGANGGRQWLLLEWIEKGNAGHSFWQQFGKALAQLHQNSQPRFGFTSNNYIGTLTQTNEWTNDWGSFYVEQRLLPLAAILYDKAAFTRTEINKITGGTGMLNAIFPAEPPALLHGDLWGGNFMVDGSGQACIYDPAVYYGHREMDIAMTLLFGGFDRELYHAYNECYPLETGWQERVRICQLYPLLVHAVLFGGHYVHECQSIIRHF